MNKKSYRWFTNGIDNIKIFDDMDVPQGYYRGRKMPDFSKEQRSSFIKKAMETKLLRYGDPHYFDKDKLRKTNLKKYGVEYPMQNKNIREKSKTTCLEKYGVEHAAQNKEISFKIKNSLKNKSEEEKYNISLKRKNTCLDRYGVENTYQSDTVKDKISATKLEKYGNKNFTNFEKSKNTKLERYGNENYRNEDKIKQTLLDRYGVDNYSKSEEFKNRVHENRDIIREKFENTLLTKFDSLEDAYMAANAKRQHTMKLRGTFNSSRLEDVADIEISKLFNCDVVRQYKDDRYPFACDFYIPSKDLFIELNAHWTHGGRPFDPNDEDCQKQLAVWQEKAKTSKFYENAIQTWTVRDVEKQRIAKENNLNYIVFYKNKLSELLETLEGV